MEYLWSLRMVSRHMDKMGRHGMLFLAAAVSDFHVPRDKLRRHKIDSSRDTARGGTALTLHLDQVNEEGGTERGWRAGGERRQSVSEHSACLLYVLGRSVGQKGHANSAETGRDGAPFSSLIGVK